MKTIIKLVIGLLIFIIFMMGSLISYLSFAPPDELSDELQQMQHALGFQQTIGVGWYRPCEYLVITSPFGWRINPITGEAGNFHNGVDLANDEGTPIYAAQSGIVLQVSQTGGYGNHVRIEHGDGFTTLYAHMEQYIVSEGQKVSGGQLIGYMGSTGNSTGPHLHFSVFNGSEYVDPMTYISDAVLSQDDLQRQIFQYLTTQMGLSPAAACGILANIEKESGFDPNTIGDDGTSYGLCQWHDTAPGVGRWTNLKNYCKKNDLDEQSVQGQLAFLHYELQTYFPSLLRSLKQTPNTSDGAFDAAYIWCTQFERPADMHNEGTTRAETAVLVYWPKFNQITKE